MKKGTSLKALVASLDSLLQPGKFEDYCPNGLQVEGRPQVRVLVSGVTASQALIEAAADIDADALLVHHGYFWKGESSPITGMKRRRIGALLARDISLLAYHLPLDAHPELGNNAQLASVLGLSVSDILGPDGLVFVGELAAATSGEAFARDLAERLGRQPLHIPAATDIQRIAWCTGAAQGYITQAIGAGVDAFLTGEVSEPTVHDARESGIHFYAAGHHATERYGVQAVGERVAAELGIAHSFIDIDNPA